MCRWPLNNFPNLKFRKYLILNLSPYEAELTKISHEFEISANLPQCGIVKV